MSEQTSHFASAFSSTCPVASSLFSLPASRCATLPLTATTDSLRSSWAAARSALLSGSKTTWVMP